MESNVQALRQSDRTAHRTTFLVQMLSRPLMPSLQGVGELQPALLELRQLRLVALLLLRERG